MSETREGRTARARFKHLYLGNDSESDTCSYEIFAPNDRYNHLQKILTFVLNGPAYVPPVEAAAHTMFMVRILAYLEALDNSCIVDKIQRLRLCGCREPVASWTPDVPRRQPLLAAVSLVPVRHVSPLLRNVLSDS